MELLFETESAGGWWPSIKRIERPEAADKESCAAAQSLGVLLFWAVPLSRAGAIGSSIVLNATKVYVRSVVGGLRLARRTGALSPRTGLNFDRAACRDKPPSK